MSFRPSPVLTLAALPVLIGLLALGTWQLGRHGEAGRWEAKVAERLAQPPLGAADLTAFAPDDADFRRVALTGTWDWGGAAFVARQYVNSVPGYRLVVPLRAGDLPGGGILVDRGWIPRTDLAASLVRARTAAGPATVRGALRTTSDFPPGEPPLALPDLPGPPRLWRTLSPREMAAAVGLPAPALFVREGDRALSPPTEIPRIWPSPGWTASFGGRPHLQYAVTWFGLAAALLGTWVGLGVQRGKGWSPT